MPVSPERARIALEIARRQFEEGEHEAALVALEIVYKAKLELPRWLYLALHHHVRQPETRSQAKQRRQRQIDLMRWAAAASSGKKGRAKFGHASGALEGTAAAGQEGAMEDSYKKVQTRHRRQRQTVKAVDIDLD